MVWTEKQRRALAAAEPLAKAAMRAAFNLQNAGSVPGQSRDSKQRRGRDRRGQNPGALRGMQNPYNHAKGSMPDMSVGNWGQTPASSNVMAPRGFGYYDAFAHDASSVATHMSIGPATPIVGTTLSSVNLISRKPGPLVDGSLLEAGAIMLVVMPAPGSIQAVAYWCSSNLAAGVISHTPYESPQLKADPAETVIPTRCSLRMRNWTQQVGVGGIVRVLRATTGLTLSVNDTTNDQLAILMHEIRTHSRTRTYGGDELLQSMQKNCTVVDQARATTFDNFDLFIPADDLAWTGPTEANWNQAQSIPPFTRVLHDPAYTPIVILIEPFVAAVSGATVGNTYEVNIRSQFLAHYAQGTMLANMAINPSHKPEALNKARDHEESKGSMFDQVSRAIEGALPYAYPILRGAVDLGKEYGPLVGKAIL
jgi:hypothetical protein